MSFGFSLHKIYTLFLHFFFFSKKTDIFLPVVPLFGGINLYYLHTMTAIELQKPSSLGHVQASLAVTLAHRVFEIFPFRGPRVVDKRPSEWLRHLRP